MELSACYICLPLYKKDKKKKEQEKTHRDIQGKSAHTRVGSQDTKPLRRSGRLDKALGLRVPRFPHLSSASLGRTRQLARPAVRPAVPSPWTRTFPRRVTPAARQGFGRNSLSLGSRLQSWGAGEGWCARTGISSDLLSFSTNPLLVPLSPWVCIFVSLPQVRKCPRGPLEHPPQGKAARRRLMHRRPAASGARPPREGLQEVQGLRAPTLLCSEADAFVRKHLAPSGGLAPSPHTRGPAAPHLPAVPRGARPRVRASHLQARTPHALGNQVPKAVEEDDYRKRTRTHAHAAGRERGGGRPRWSRPRRPALAAGPRPAARDPFLLRPGCSTALPAPS